MKSGKVVLGLLAGIATGALLGILFAPHSGAKTRKRLMNKGEGYADALKDKFGVYIDTLRKGYDDVKEGYDDAKDEVLDLASK
jgi:gas vesicle protein